MTIFQNFLLIVFISFFIINDCPAQNNWQKSSEEYKNNYNLAREIVFLHLNKTSVAPAENIWFSAYVYDVRKHLPDQETMNLNLTIFNEGGVNIESKVLYVSNGKGSAFIHLDPQKFIPGKYFIQASTDYMQNFKEDLTYIQPFEVLGKQQTDIRSEEEFDLQLLPEGGHLLAGVVNSVGVKLINKSGEGVPFDGVVMVDTNNVEITTFRSNSFGISKFFFLPESNKQYTLKVQTENGDNIEKNISRAAKRGISLVSTARDEDFLLSLRTNPGTREEIKDEIFLIAIHRDGKIKNLELKFPADKMEANILISKDSLYPGVNTITVFDEEFQPRLERLIFNDKGLKRAGIRGRMIGNEGDSIAIQLTSTSPVKNTSLSVSVLPSETLANNPNHNIISAFWLKPYVRGTIENANHYFSGRNSKRKNHDLDLLLLTQGWSKYNWKDTGKNEVKEVYKRATGFEIVGKVEGRRKRNENSLLIRSDEESGFFEIVPINENNSFKIENIYVADSTAFSFSLIDEKKNRMSKPAIQLNIFPLKNQEDKENIFEITKVKKSGLESIDIPEGFIGEAVALDTVMLTSKTKVNEKYGGDIPLIEQKIEITQEIANMFHYIKDFIGTKGFRVQDTDIGGVEITSRFRSSIMIGDLRPIIYFNNARVGRDFPLLSTLPSSEVESITISRRGNGEGMDGVNGVIKINTKQGGTTDITKKNTVTRIITSNGFVENKEFYAPKYNSYSHSAFRNFGAIDWRPNLFLDMKGNTKFNVLNVLQPEINLYIEGMSAGGVLFSEVLTVKTR